MTSLFHHVVASDMPESEKNEDRLVKEAALLLSGGTFTSSRTMGVAAYRVLSNPDLRERLAAELKEPMADWPEKVPKWADLEKLPLLQGVIKETLRCVQ